MEARTRTLRQSGTSVTATIPPELLRASGMRAGDQVVLTAQEGRIVIEPGTRVSRDLAAFADRFVQRYREDLARLAEL